MPSIASRPVGTTGYGLMGLTWRPDPVPEPQAHHAMTTALNAGATFWNAGEFYGTPTYNSLHLLNHYFTANPSAADKVVLSVKGAVGPMGPDGSPEGVRRSVDNCLKILDEVKKLDVFECARVDPKTDIEVTVGALAELVRNGKIGGIGLSEVRAETVRRAAKIHPIAAVEVELSLWATEPLTNGVAAACNELGIPLVAYSPLGRGFLTGQIQKAEDIPEGDLRRRFPRFQPENFDKNMELVKQLQGIAEKKGCTAAQLAMSWVKGLNGREGMPTIIPIPGATTEERILENVKDVALTEAERVEIDEILRKANVVGGRYDESHAALLEG